MAAGIDIDGSVALVTARCADVSILVNNAGVSTSTSPLSDAGCFSRASP